MKFKSNFNLKLESAEDCGQNLEVQGGLFSKSAPEGVWSALGRWIQDGRRGLKEEKQREGGGCTPARGEEGGGGAPLPERARLPELGIRALRCTIFQITSTGRKRRTRRIRSRALCGRGRTRAARSMVGGHRARRSTRLAQ